MELVPAFVTHYHHPDRAPFLNLSDLDDAGLNEALHALRGESEIETSQRRFGSRYMALRRATEERLRSRFIARGGKPTRQSPHYFVLGESAWFGGLYRDAGAISIPLAALDPAEVSLTYPDSVTSMGFLGDFGIEVNPREYHGQVYLLEDLPGLVQRFGIPTGERPTSYEGHQFDAAFEHYVEVQVWSDTVLNHYPQASGSSAKGSSR